jgi:thymidylate synthase (FAD)
MKTVNPSFEILDPVDGVEILKRLEAYGRTCYKSEDKITEGSASRFIRMLLQRNPPHESVLEHEKVTVRVVCDRGVSHEIVRHRIASYSQESTRYCDYAKAGEIQILDISPHLTVGQLEAWRMAMLDAERHYTHLRELGAKPELARSVLPNSLKTEIVITYNLREWRHFFRMRTAAAAHPQMRELTIPMLAEFRKRIPIIFEEL